MPKKRVAFSSEKVPRLSSSKPEMRGPSPYGFVTFRALAAFAGLTIVALGSSSCSPARSSEVAAAPVIDRAVIEPGRLGATIDVEPGGPADTVRAFYGHLREKRFREAIFLTNLRPAIEGLTDVELRDFALDFEAIAGQVPATVEINGEIVSGEKATVTVNLPKAAGEEKETQTINLRRNQGAWVILSVDEAAESRMRKDGKNYFYNLRIETHEDEARQMLDRISKAQFAYSVQNGGVFGDLNALLAAGLLPDDIRTSASTGYNYEVALGAAKETFRATATPAEYGRSGRLSFLLGPDRMGSYRLISRDNGGKKLEK